MDLLSNCCDNFKKTVAFDDMVHFIDEEDIVTYLVFDCGFTLYPEAPRKIEHINREQKNFSQLCENPNCIPSNDQRNSCFDGEHISSVFLDPYDIWDVDPATPLLINLTPGRDPMTTQYRQTSTCQPKTD